MPKPQLLVESDRSRLVEYISHEPEMNLFISGDIEQFGLADPVSVYAFVRPDDLWDSIVLCFYGNFVVYSHNPLYDAEAVADFISSAAPTGVVGSINGKLEILGPLAGYFRDLDLRPQNMARILKVDHDAVVDLDTSYELRRLTPDDYDELFALLATMDEYRGLYEDAASIEMAKVQREANEKKGCRTYGIFFEGELVSTASTSAASSDSAMIIGVGTREDMRREGLATAVVAHLCDECFDAGMRFVCLFYGSPEAGRMYERIGFRRLGTYAMLR